MDHASGLELGGLKTPVPAQFIDPSSNRSALLVGLEYEYRVRDGERQLDFRNIITRLGLGGGGLDPADPYAHRLPSGDALTCDQGEAEVALPPLRCARGFAGHVELRAAASTAALRRLLPPALAARGYSTHLSVSMPRQLNERVARLYLRTFAPGLMLLLDRANSPGLLVRPRPHRTELGGEFAEGYVLRAAAAFAVGSVRACAAAVAGGHAARAALPPELIVRVAPDTHRYGWYVDRRAFGEDLYASGRETPLRLTSGGVLSAQRHLELAWAAARAALSDLAGPEDCIDADAMVAGTLPLPSEDAARAVPSPSGDIGTTAFGSVLKPRRRPGFELAPVMVTWDVNVFLVVNEDRTRRAFACVPRDQAQHFLIALLRGELDEPITAYLSQPSRGSRLDRHDQTAVFGLYDELGPRVGLLPFERSPQQGRLTELKAFFRTAA